MHGISKINLLSLLGVLVVLAGFGMYTAAERQVGADVVSYCQNNCAQVQVAIEGINDDRTLTDGKQLVASVTIRDAQGKTVTTNGSAALLAENRSSMLFGPYQPGNGYKVELNFTNSLYQMNPGDVSSQSLTLEANKTSTVSFPVELKSGALTVLSRVSGGASGTEKLADVIATGDGNIYADELKATELATINWDAKPAVYTIELKNINPNFRLKSDFSSPRTNVKSLPAQAQSIEFQFDRVITEVQSTPSTQPAAAPSPSPSPFTQASPSSSLTTVVAAANLTAEANKKDEQKEKPNPQASTKAESKGKASQKPAANPSAKTNGSRGIGQTVFTLATTCPIDQRAECSATALQAIELIEKTERCPKTSKSACGLWGRFISHFTRRYHSLPKGSEVTVLSSQPEEMGQVKQCVEVKKGKRLVTFYEIDQRTDSQTATVRNKRELKNKPCR